MRFAAMFWLRKDAKLGEFSWHPKKRQLILRLTAEAVPLYGEVAETRLSSLADTLQAGFEVRLPRGRG